MCTFHGIISTYHVNTFSESRLAYHHNITSTCKQSCSNYANTHHWIFNKISENLINYQFSLLLTKTMEKSQTKICHTINLPLSRISNVIHYLVKKDLCKLSWASMKIYHYYDYHKLSTHCVANLQHSSKVFDSLLKHNLRFSIILDYYNRASILNSLGDQGSRIKFWLETVHFLLSDAVNRVEQQC